MVRQVLGLVITLLLTYTGYCQNPPTVEYSYIAWGEIVQPLQNTFDLIVIQSTFEESYDADTKNAAFFLYELGKNLTFVKNYADKQTYLYVESGDDLTVSSDDDDDNDKEEKPRLRCLETNEKQWEGSDIAPGLLSFEDEDGRVRFSINQLLNIPSKYMRDEFKGVKTTYRGIPAKSWLYLIKSKTEDEQYDITLDIQSYWSDGTWNSSAGLMMTPLGFNISKIIWLEKEKTQTEDYVINIFGFVPGAYDHKYFKPIEGVVCPNKKSTLKFPNVHNIPAISFHSELALPDYQELRYIDTWFDPTNQLVRVDLERLDADDPLQTKSKRYQSEIAIGKMGIVYRWGYDRGQSFCEVIPFEKYKNDMQNLFDIKQDLRRWKMGKIFGLNDTSYVYIGQAIKNDIPCHMFQGIRTDWPDPESKIKSLWEWCFNVNMTDKSDVFLFRGDEFGLISANVIILSDPENIYKNYRMKHHFYEVKRQDPKILDATSFDIGRCFKDTEKKLLQFYLNIKIGNDNFMMIENATSDITFLQRWKDAIYKYSELPYESLRISNVRSTINGDKLYIKFSILSLHKDLPESMTKGQKTAFDAEQKLRDNINDGKVSIMYQFQKGKTTTLYAEKHSVSLQIDPNFEPYTMPPIPDITTPTTKSVFSLRTEPSKNPSVKPPVTDTSKNPPFTVTGVTASSQRPTQPDDGVTTPIPDKKKHIVKYTGHQPGAVAGVSIAMLLVGISIGASGTFYKFNGLPECMRR